MRSAAVLLGLVVASAAASPSGILGRAGRAGRAAVHNKRTTDIAQLYAYGTNISGLAVYAGPDNLAYVATADAATNLTAMTWTIDASGTNAWTVSANATTPPATNPSSSLAPGSTFYIVSGSANGESFTQAGFASNMSSAPAGAMTTGFVTYGPTVMVIAAETDSGEDGNDAGKTTYASEFWASATDTDGVWTLMWNEAGTAQDNSVPLTIKTTAPMGSELA